MVFSFFGVFCTSLLNQVEHTWLKSQFHICNYGELEFFLLTRILTQNLNIVDLVKFLEKKKTSHSDRSGYIEGDIMQNHELKKKGKKGETKILWAKQTSFLAPYPLALGEF
jgi:hypothetical protein